MTTAATWRRSLVTWESVATPVEDVAYMLEKPQKFEDDWQEVKPGWLKAEGRRASARLSTVPGHARSVRLVEPGGDCDAE